MQTPELNRAKRPPGPGGEVLVTGAGGFIGSHLTAHLVERGRVVRALDTDLDRIRDLKRVRLLEGDFTDAGLQRRALAGVDTVFHLAALHLEVGKSQDAFWRVNVDGVRSLIEAARRAHIKRFVHCSSVGVYGRIAHPPADEETPCEPEHPYETSKLAGERVVVEAIEGCAFPAVILRPAWVYGPGCPRTEKLFRMVQCGSFVVAGRGERLRHCVYIRDMLQALHLAATVKRALGKTIIVADARAVTVRALVDEIARLTGSRRPRELPLLVLAGAVASVEAIWRMAGRPPPISRRSLRFFTANTSFDISRARQVLGFEPRFDLAAGLAETFTVLRGGHDRPLPPTRSATV